MFHGQAYFVIFFRIVKDSIDVLIYQSYNTYIAIIKKVKHEDDNR
jgi:hypothetical protein